jgi:hypothetical protein
LNLNERPSSSGNISFVLISYNCSSSPNITDSQIKLKANYADSKCDQIKKSQNINKNSLSVSISSTLNKNCRGI